MGVPIIRSPNAEQGVLTVKPSAFYIEDREILFSLLFMPCRNQRIREYIRFSDTNNVPGLNK